MLGQLTYLMVHTLMTKMYLWLKCLKKSCEGDAKVYFIHVGLMLLLLVMARSWQQD